MKQCTKCHEFKPKTLDFFHYRKESKDKLKSSCKNCQNKCAEIYREKNPDKVKKIAQESRRKHSSKRLAATREWHKKNKEWRTRWENENKEKRAQYKQKYQQNLSEEKKQQQLIKSQIRSRKWREKNPDYQSKYHKNYALKNQTKLSVISRNYKARKKKATGSHNKQDVENIIKKQKGLCFWCNVKLNKIHMDHYIPLKRGGSNDASNLVASCPKCNQSKGAKMPWEYKAQELFPQMKVTHATADALLIATYGTKQQ